jgi:hypothetical protein
MSQDRANEPEHDFPRKIGQPATRALIAAGYTRLEQLTSVSEREVLKLHGMGPKALGILRDTLVEQGQSFAGAPRNVRAGSFRKSAGVERDSSVS